MVRFVYGGRRRVASYPTANGNIRFFKSETSIPDFLNAFASEETDVEERILLLLTFVGEEVVAFLQDYTAQTKPGDKRQAQASRPVDTSRRQGASGIDILRGTWRNNANRTGETTTQSAVVLG